MSTPEGGISTATPDVSNSAAVGGTQIPADSSPAPQAATDSPSSADVNAQSVQGETVNQQTETDPLAGFPPDEELAAAVANKTPFAEMAARIKSAYEQLKPQVGDLTDKLKPFEPYLDRFSSPEEVQQVVDLKEQLFGWERDSESGQLIPATQSFAQNLATTAPETADFLAADLMNGLTTDPESGRQMPRIDLALESIAQDPERRAKALQILGGVEPNSLAPQWQPTAEELEVVKPELQDVYKKLPFEEREELKLASPDFINRTLEKEKFQQELMAQNKQAQALQTQQQEQRERYMQQQADNAGNQYVETQFKAGFAEFAQSIVERSQFIAPLDPQSPEAQAMGPEGVQQFNQQAQQVNSGVGKMIATVTAALSHPDTAWVALDFLKGIGVDDKTIQGFDQARQEFARNARDYGHLNYKASLGQQPNGNGQQQHAGLGVLQSNATRAMKNMKGMGNLVAKPLMELMSRFFEMKAGSYNQTLNSAAGVRPPITGTAFDPTTAATQRPIGKTREEIYGRSDIERMAL